MNYTLAVFALLSPAWLVAYSPEQSRQYEVIVPVEEATLITNAVNEWQNAVPDLRMQITIGGAEACQFALALSPYRVICVEAVPQAILADATGHEGILGLTIMHEEMAYIALPPDSGVDTAAHELGHAMGLRHDRHCGTLMFPAMYDETGKRCDAPGPTPRDIAAWHRIER